MRKIVIFILLLFVSLSTYAQGEANIWYFGDYAGLDFNTGSPVALTDGQLMTEEGCASISNAAGQLLFYTDGRTIYNRLHQIMLNGTNLKGHSTSTQSATIVPKPGSSSLFYVFTIDAVAGVNGFRYSIVDLNLDGGLGAVTADKNILIYTSSCEKISIVKHANNSDFWIITHGYESDLFYAHLLTSNGLNLTPVISKSGMIVTKDYWNLNTQGYMKISANGSKLVLCHQHLNTVELFDFNSSTGIISNSSLISNSLSSPYGAEFSPNSEVLYISTLYGGEIYQFDINAADVASSEKLIYKLPYFLGSLQLGPDNKIYIATYQRRKLSVINKPNVVGTGCDLLLDSIDLGGKICEFGLPAFNQSFFFSPEIQLTNSCKGEAAQFGLNTNEVILSAEWDFGDGNTSTDIKPTHTYANTGTFTVSVTATSSNGTGTKTRDIVISEVPTATKPLDLLVCDTNNDGFYTFDLSSQTTAILNGQDPNLYGVNYLVNNVVIANPSSHANNVAYQQETITAEVYNKANSSCKSTTNFTIDVFDTPKPSTSVSKISLCDNTSIGTDTDGKVVFDLSQRATEILNGLSATQFVLSYYKDAALTQNISNPSAYQNTNATETIYVKVVNKDNLNCIALTSFQIEVMALPTINTTVDLKQCDDNIDGFSVFNLEEAIAKITSNAAVETISFYKTIADAQNNSNPIANRTAYTNQTVSVDKVFVRVTNANGCYRVAQLNLIVSTTQIPVTFSRSFTQCDDVASGSNTDGIATFDFSSVDSEVRTIFPSGQLLDITYYRNLADALAEKNAITNISNYSNIGYPNTQNIYIRVDSRLNNDCLGLGSYITLNVEPIPIVTPITSFVHCDDNQDGYYAFNVTGLDSQLKNGKNVSISYFDANNNALASPLPNPFSTKSQTIKARITNNTATACYYDTTIQFVVDVLPQAFAVPTALTTVCDDEVDPNTQDGKYAFNTSTFQNTILASQTGMIVKYFDENNNLLSSPLPNPFITITQNVRVEVINPANSSCVATTTIPFVVHPVPNIALEGDELVCSNLPSFTKVIDAGIQDGSSTTDYTYNWFFNGNAIVGENNYSLTVNKEGSYSVEVSSSQGCSRTRTITVTASDIAVITNVDIVELSSSNSISVSVSGNGDYVFALDDQSGVYQTENTFSNVAAGIHTVFVKDLNGCGITPKEVAILGIPNFFTPNQDGYNDTWNIKGVNAAFNAKTIIQIFDRYGKLIKQISPTGLGWDGTINGNPMPASDYWYSVQMEDGRVMKGHFSLKR